MRPLFWPHSNSPHLPSPRVRCRNPPGRCHAFSPGCVYYGPYTEELMRWCLMAVIFCAVSLGGQTVSPASSASKALHDLIAAEWEYEMQQFPEAASGLGDRRWNDRWSDQNLQ